MTECPGCGETEDLKFTGDVIVNAYQHGEFWRCENLDCRVDQFIRNFIPEELQRHYGNVILESNRTLIHVSGGSIEVD
jgi:hypothetical protein